MYIYGKNIVRERLASGGKITRALISKKFRDQDLIDDLRRHNIKISFVDNTLVCNL